MVQCCARIVGAPDIELPVDERVRRENYMKVALAVDLQEIPAHDLGFLKQDW